MRCTGRAGPKAPWEQALAPFLAPPCAIVGLGNRLCGDDGFGPALIDALRGRVGAVLLDAGCAPENYLGQLVTLAPQRVLFVDAGHIHRAPGEIAVLPPEALAPGSIATHAASPALLAGFLHGAVQAETRFLLVQPARTTVVATDPQRPSLSPPVRRAVKHAARAIASLLAAPSAHRAAVC